jgi:hypothetical protein
VPRILTLNPPFRGLTSAVNVLDRVGTKQANSVDDVKIVQKLLQLCSKGSEFASEIGLPPITGRFDAATGFWIYRFQDIDHKKMPSNIIDGIISPAHGGSYGGGTWTIISMNLFAKEKDPQGHADFVASGGTVF